MNRRSFLLRSLIGLTLLTSACIGRALGDDTGRPSSAAPKVIRTKPAIGSTEVSTDLQAIEVTFDRDMTSGMSWTGAPNFFPPKPDGVDAKWIDKRTCVLPVRLENASFYRIGVNSTSYRNFQSVDGKPANPIAIYFATVGASKDLVAKTQTPEIVSLSPANGDHAVSPSVGELRVTFNMPMGDGMSWTGGGDDFPEIDKSRSATWSDDKMTCTMPVKLQPGRKYRLGLNSRSFHNFTSEAGVPFSPIVYTFETK